MVVQLYSTAFSAHSLAKGIEKGDDYLSVMSSAVSFQFENQKKAEIEIESLQKTKSGVSSIIFILQIPFFWIR
jgi:hypothetical protein